jgi:hypothetical protein
VCICGCTADTCLLVLCMLVIHAYCLFALLVCVVDGKSGCCLDGCFVLLHLLRIYECVVAMHGEERWRESWEVGPAVVRGVRAAAVGEGVRAWVRCSGDGGGVGARAVVGQRARER